MPERRRNRKHDVTRRNPAGPAEVKSTPRLTFDSCIGRPSIYTFCVKGISSKPQSGTIDTQEPIGKTVGCRTGRNLLRLPPTEERERIRRWREAFPTPGVPKGVYRFKTFEEADEWMWKAITRKR